MRPWLFLLAVFAWAAAPATPATAVEYPWCSNFADGAGANCGFTSYEQCMATARGTGGYCAENTMYAAPAGAARPRPVPRHRRPAKKD